MTPTVSPEPLIDDMSFEGKHGTKKPHVPYIFNWGGGQDDIPDESVNVKIDVIHNNVKQLKKRLDEKNEKNTHDDVIDQIKQ